MIRSHGTKLHILISKLRSETSKAKAGPGGLARVALFWKLLTIICNFVQCDRIMQRAINIYLLYENERALLFQFYYLDLKNSPCFFAYLDLVWKTKMYLKLIIYFILYYLLFRVYLFIQLFCKKNQKTSFCSFIL